MKYQIIYHYPVLSHIVFYLTEVVLSRLSVDKRSAKLIKSYIKSANYPIEYSIDGRTRIKLEYRIILLENTDHISSYACYYSVICARGAPGTKFHREYQFDIGGIYGMYGQGFPRVTVTDLESNQVIPDDKVINVPKHSRRIEQILERLKDRREDVIRIRGTGYLIDQLHPLLKDNILGLLHPYNNIISLISAIYVCNCALEHGCSIGFQVCTCKCECHQTQTTDTPYFWNYQDLDNLIALLLPSEENPKEIRLTLSQLLNEEDDHIEADYTDDHYEGHLKKYNAKIQLTKRRNIAPG